MWQRDPKYFWRYFRQVGEDILHVNDLRMMGVEHQDEFPYVWYINNGDEHPERSLDSAKSAAELVQSIQESFRQDQGK